MAGRTIAIGDIHGDIVALTTLLDRLPELDAEDTLVFLGDYVDGGPDSAAVIEMLRNGLPKRTSAKLVFLRGNHEDAWLRVIDEGWIGFVMPQGNGCRACYRSFADVPQDTPLTEEQLTEMINGTFYPPEVVEWMAALPYWYEDDHAIYVHAGLEQTDAGWLHPSHTQDRSTLLWTRKREFFLEYAGKTVIVGHTGTCTLPQDQSLYTPDDPDDVYWAGRSTYAIDTLAGKGGFLSAIEMPGYQVFESR